MGKGQRHEGLKSFNHCAATEHGGPQWALEFRQCDGVSESQRQGCRVPGGLENISHIFLHRGWEALYRGGRGQE